MVNKIKIILIILFAFCVSLKGVLLFIDRVSFLQVLTTISITVLFILITLYIYESSK